MALPAWIGLEGGPGQAGRAGAGQGRRSGRAGRSHFRPAETGYLTAADGDPARGGAVVEPHGVGGGGEAGIDGRVRGALTGAAFPDERVSAVAAAGRADFDLVATSFRRRVQDEGADALAQLEDDAAGTGRAGDYLGHCGRAPSQDAGVLKPLYAV